MFELFAWFRSRVLKPRILALTLLPGVAVIGAGIDTQKEMSELVLTLLLGGMLVIPFRLWDDMQDREYDQTKNRIRILTTTNNFLPFWRALALSLIIASVMLVCLNGTARLLAMFILVFLMAMLYWLLPAMTEFRVLRDRLVLLKYPTFVILLAPDVFLPSVGIAAIFVLMVVAVIDAIDN